MDHFVPEGRAGGLEPPGESHPPARKLHPLAYGLERIAMYLQDKESVYDVVYSDTTAQPVLYGDLYQRAEWEWSTYNFEMADVAEHFAAFDHCEAEAKRLLAHGADAKGKLDPTKALVLPAYDFVVKAAHRFDWQIPDPREMPPEEFRKVRYLIGAKVKELLSLVVKS